MTTCAQLIERARRDLLSGWRERRNTLGLALDSRETNVKLDHEIVGVTEGTIFAVDLELMYVWTSNLGAQTVVVERGQNTTVAAGHKLGSQVIVNPVVPPNMVLDAINDELDSLPGLGIWRMATIDLQTSSGKLTYELPVENVIDVYDVTFDDRTHSNSWPHPHSSWTLRRGADPDEFPSGLALRINDWLPEGRRMVVSYKTGFDPLGALADDVEAVTGLPASAHAILSLGAQMRLMGQREAKRTFTESQPDTRRGPEAPVGSSTRAAGTLGQLHRERVNAERMRLHSTYPTYARA